MYYKLVYKSVQYITGTVAWFTIFWLFKWIAVCYNKHLYSVERGARLKNKISIRKKGKL